MTSRLLPCPACRCHVKSLEVACPHCGLEFTAGRALAPSGAAPIHARRIALAAALAGLSAACGGQVSTQETSSLVTGTAVTSTCLPPADGGVTPSCALAECQCAPSDVCVNNVCTYEFSCGPNSHLNSQGSCVSDYWFDNVNLPQPSPSPASCYGAPPARS